MMMVMMIEITGHMRIHWRQNRNQHVSQEDADNQFNIMEVACNILPVDKVRIGLEK